MQMREREREYNTIHTHIHYYMSHITIKYMVRTTTLCDDTHITIRIRGYTHYKNVIREQELTLKASLNVEAPL